MRILYLDTFSGISGDMTVGALADLGITPSTFEWELSKLELGDCHLHFERQTRAGISGVKFDVHSGATHDASQDQETEHPAALTGKTANAHDHLHHDHQHHDREHHDHEHHDHASHLHRHQGHGRQPQPTRGFFEIRALLEGSYFSDFVKQHAT